MNTTRKPGWIGGLSVFVLLYWTNLVSAQTFSSGSTGADGVFAPTANMTVTLPPNGVFNYTTVNIPTGVTVTYTKNAANTPVTILATGDVTIAGTINLNGGNGLTTSSTVMVNPGGQGGPGGFDGGNGGVRGGGTGSGGKGPGGGGTAVFPGSGAGGGGYGAPATFVSLLPLFGGSGGGGGSGDNTPLAGASGGGGGGAVVIASSTQITVTGSITANGGTATNNGVCGNGGGAGSGGAIRLVARQLAGTGTLQALGGTVSGCAAAGGAGVIRLEAFTLGFNGTITPAASVSASPGPVTAASNPALINLPTLTINSVGAVAPPATPGGSYTTADVSLPTGTTNPVAVTLSMTNIPVGTVFTVKLIPQFAAPTPLSSSASTGTFATSTATANVTFPTGQVSVLNAFGSFTLPQLASLFPLIDGEEVDRIMVAAAYGEPSSVTLLTKSGREVRPDQLPLEGQAKLAQAFDALAREP